MRQTGARNNTFGSHAHLRVECKLTLVLRNVIRGLKNTAAAIIWLQGAMDRQERLNVSFWASYSHSIQLMDEVACKVINCVIDFDNLITH